MITIPLKFKNTVVALAGNPYGKQVFKDQVLNVINDKQKNLGDTANTEEQIEIVFPDQITYATSSFIQGFFDYWLTTIGKEKIHANVIIKSVHESVVNYIWENIE